MIKIGMASLAQTSWTFLYCKYIQCVAACKVVVSKCFSLHKRHLSVKEVSHPLQKERTQYGRGTLFLKVLSQINILKLNGKKERTRAVQFLAKVPKQISISSVTAFQEALTDGKTI